MRKASISAAIIAVSLVVSFGISHAAMADANSLALLEALKVQLAALQEKFAKMETSTPAAPSRACTTDVKICADGSFVGRDSAAGCAFRVCSNPKDKTSTSGTLPSATPVITITAPVVGEVMRIGKSVDDLSDRYSIKFNVAGVKSYIDLEYKIELFRDKNKLGHIGWPAVRPVHMESEFWDFNWDVGSYYNADGDYKYAPAGQGYRIKITLLQKSKAVSTFEREIEIAGGTDTASSTISASTAAFTAPGPGVFFMAGSLEYIRWAIAGNRDVSEVSTGTLAIIDAKTKDIVATVDSKVRNTYGRNVYAWSVPRSLDSGMYAMRLSYTESRLDGSATTNAFITTPVFTVLNSSRPAVIITAPTAASVPVVRAGFSVGWYLLGAAESPVSTAIYLEKDGSSEDPFLVAADAKTDVRTRKNFYSYEWPNSYYSGGYRIRIEALFKNGKKATGISEIFRQSQ